MPRPQQSIIFRLCLLLGMCAAFSVSAQREHKLEFKKGLLVSMPPKTINAKDTVIVVQSDDILTDNMIKQMKQALLTKIEATIDNMENERLQLNILYDELWGAGWSTVYIHELKQLKTFLQTGIDTFKNYKYLPSPADLRSLLDNKKVIFTSKTNEKIDKKTIEIIFNDPYANWLATRYNTYSAPQVKDLSMNSDYRNGWRRLETLRDTMQQTRTELAAKKGKLIRCSADSSIESAKQLLAYYATESKTNGAFTLLRINFFKEWLWYTEGVLTTNPFFFTTPDKEYPDKLKNTDSQAINAIIESKKKNEALFKGKSVHNKVEIVHSNKGETKTIQHFDALNKYSHTNYSKENLTDGDDITWAVHNIHKDVNIALEIQAISDSTLNANGAFTAGLSEPLSLIASISSTTFLKGALTLLSSQAGQQLIPDPRSPQPPGATPDNPEEHQKMSRLALELHMNGHIDNNEYASIMTSSVDRISNFVITDSTGKPIVVVYDDIYYEITQKNDPDKKALLEKYAYYSDLNKNTIDAFLKKDVPNRINYDTTMLIASVERLFNAFERHLEEVDNCNEDAKTLIDSLQDKINILNRALAIVDRSLPPTNVEISEKTDAPVYRTESIALPLDANKKRKVALTETTGPKDNPKKQVVYTETYKVGEYKLWGASAGVAYTYNRYNRVTISDDGKAEIKNDNAQWHAIAGLHIYPAKINNNDDRWIWEKGVLAHRTSIFLGLDISQPLHNFYPGISFDFIPGLKIINGPHIITDTRYRLYNNTVADKAMGLKIAGWYSSIAIDPASFIKLFL